MDKETRILRIALLVHVLNWFLVFSPFAAAIEWLTWGLWLAVPTVVVITLASVARLRSWTPMRGLLLVVAVLNGISVCLITRLPIDQDLDRGFAFVATSMVLPLMMLAELSSHAKRVAAQRQAMSNMELATAEA